MSLYRRADQQGSTWSLRRTPNQLPSIAQRRRSPWRAIEEARLDRNLTRNCGLTCRRCQLQASPTPTYHSYGQRITRASNATWMLDVSGYGVLARLSDLAYCSPKEVATMPRTSATFPTLHQPADCWRLTHQSLTDPPSPALTTVHSEPLRSWSHGPAPFRVDPPATH